ncbi:hypothetical protein Clacol_003975 [Clathrus columnatus]|uniref:Uncharacterized protein n=1 Tax=Clathrus columnatus TaxID=1419009 RepID=A0AAV5A536_9AGAM|nr:hypothetical protein Clacol_003975 [Clathrus columnatus]
MLISDDNNDNDKKAIATQFDDNKGVQSQGTDYPPEPKPSFSIYTTREKWIIIALAGLAGLFRFFPETLRVVVGNGSIPAPRWNTPLIPVLTHYSSATDISRPPPKKFANPLKAFRHPSVVLLLFYIGVLYSVFYGVTATLSELFMDAYPFLSESEIGLCFLAVGVGCGVGSYTNGRLLDLDFKRIKRKWEEKLRQDGRGSELVNSKITGRETEDFPYEYARLRTIPIYVVIYAAVLVGYGWSIQQRVNIACPLILQFIGAFYLYTLLYIEGAPNPPFFLVGVIMTAVINTAQTLLLDLYPTQGSSITAAVSSSMKA